MQSLLHTRAGQALHCAQAAALETDARQAVAHGCAVALIHSLTRADGQFASMRVGETTRALHAWMGGWAGADEEAAIHWGDPLVAAGQYQKNQGIVVPSRSAPTARWAPRATNSTQRCAATAVHRTRSCCTRCKCAAPDLQMHAPTHACEKTHARTHGGYWLRTRGLCRTELSRHVAIGCRAHRCNVLVVE